MGKGSGKAKMPADTQFDKDMKQQGPGMSDPVGPLLQLTGMGDLPGLIGQIDWTNSSFADQLGALPQPILDQIKIAGMQRPVPTAPVQQAPAKKKLGV
jgi:hypothetical protein